MTAEAPASFSISALMSPVNAPAISVLAILPTDGDPAGGGLRRPRDQRRGQADQNVGEWRRSFHRGGNCLDFDKLRRQTVHLPISGDQRPHDGPSERIRRRQT